MATGKPGRSGGRAGGKSQSNGNGKGGQPEPPGLVNLRAGLEILAKHAGFRHIEIGGTCGNLDCERAPRGGLVVVDSAGRIHPNVWNRAEPDEWAWAVAHAQLHLGFGHLPASFDDLPESEPDSALRAARCVVVNRFLQGFKVGTPPFPDEDWPAGDEETLAAAWRAGSVPAAQGLFHRPRRSRSIIR